MENDNTSGAEQLSLTYFITPSRSIRFRRFRFDVAVNQETFLNGSSEFIGEMASAVSMFAFNYVLMKYVGAEEVAAFTILGFAVYGYSMIAIGFGQGVTPLVSVCWGVKEQKTAMVLHGMTNRILFAIGVLFAVFCLIFEKQVPFLKTAASKRALKHVALANRRRKGDLNPGSYPKTAVGIYGMIREIVGEKARKQLMPLAKSQWHQLFGFFGAVGGIRTLVPLLTTTRFPVVLVMTSSIPLHIHVSEEHSNDKYTNYSAFVKSGHQKK